MQQCNRTLKDLTERHVPWNSNTHNATPLPKTRMWNNN